jgi:hypothetical protein
MFNPNYKTPRSIQMNIGLQRQLKPGIVLSADYLRNVQTHYLLGIDENHAGDIHYFSKNGALAAINATNAAFSCPSGPAGLNCAIAAGATISNYASNGLGSSSDIGGSSCPAALGYDCAFGGINPNAPPLHFLSSIGRSVYNGLHTKLSINIKRPLLAIRTFNLQMSYALSRFENTGAAVGPDSPVTARGNDQDYIIPSLDNADPNRYFGPSTLDRTHQLSFGGYLFLPAGVQLGLISHFYSPLSTTLTVPNTALGAGEIFRTDFTGDGTPQDPVPGTHVGEFDRGINASNIDRVLTNYNNSVALQLTPAGQMLLQSGLFTAGQLGVGDSLCYNNPNNQPLNSLCAIAPTIPLAPAGQVNLSWLRSLDLRAAWSHTFRDGITIQPSAGFYNLFNFANFDLPESMMSGLLAGTAGTINGTDPVAHNANRVGVGTGVFSLGSPRELEFSLKISF